MSNPDLFRKDTRAVRYTVQEMRILRNKPVEVRKLVEMVKTEFPGARVVSSAKGRT